MNSNIISSKRFPTILLVILFFLPVIALASPLAITTRFARPTDLRAVWILRDSTRTCPKNVTHTAWNSRTEGTYNLPHNNIIQDDVQCSSPSREHTLTFHLRSAYGDNLQPVSGPELPEETLRQLRGDTVARRALQAGDRANEEYLLGYEARVRQCGGVASFEDGTVVFVFRPFTDKLRMEGVEEKLGKGLKWMVIAPREGGLCVYSSDVNGPDDGAKGNSNGSNETGGESGDGSDGESGDDGPACFPGDAKVLTRTRGLIQIGDVRVGEYVSGGGGSWTKVVGFSHRDSSVITKMVEIWTEYAVRVKASSGHYLYSSRGLTAAGDVRVGDFIRLENGTMSSVLNVRRVTASGLFNVQTISGDIVVDNVWASTYTTAVQKELAHAALTPLRLAATLVEFDLVSSAVDGGLRWLAGTRIVS